MKRRILAYFLTVIMTLSLIPVSAYAAESTNEETELPSSAVNAELSQNTPVKPASFSKEETDAILNGEEDGAITIGEMMSLMDITYSYLQKDRDQLATVYDFLYEFY